MSALHCKSPRDVLQAIKNYEISFVDIKFSDPFGQLQHLTLPSHQISEESFRFGIAFDGSSIRGWKHIDESDMQLIPDPMTAFIDPFFQEHTLSLMCDVIDPITKEPYEMDSRQIAKKAVQYLKDSGIGDQAFFGPECEFFIFDNLSFSDKPGQSFYQVDSIEASWNSHLEGNGYQIPYKRGYFPTAPLDKTNDIRLQMMKTLEEAGISVERGHHEVGTAGQGEINFKFSDLVDCADKTQIYKYVLRNVGDEYEKFVTFLPKPIAGDNGSGMHCHLSIWKNQKNLFAGKEYAGLSQEALWAIGGIIKHGPALAAITNPTLNSYHRLVPGFEAPIRLAYCARNRSAAIRIPVAAESDATRRIECRFPDGSSNPYLAFSALLCAVIDGIQNQIDPGKPLKRDIYAMDKEELRNINQLPGSLEQALKALELDSEFLTKSGVFSQEFLVMWIQTKQQEIDAIRLVPHPKEFELYYDV